MKSLDVEFRKRTLYAQGKKSIKEMGADRRGVLRMVLHTAFLSAGMGLAI